MKILRLLFNNIPGYSTFNRTLGCLLIETPIKYHCSYSCTTLMNVISSQIWINVIKTTWMKKKYHTKMWLLLIRPQFNYVPYVCLYSSEKKGKMFTNCTSVPKNCSVTMMFAECRVHSHVFCSSRSVYEMKYNYEDNLEERTIKNILLRETSFTCVPFISPKKSLSLANLLWRVFVRRILSKFFKVLLVPVYVREIRT